MTYDISRIAWELDQTALGNSFYGNALYSARDLPCITNNDRDCLNRWLFGNETPQDRITLQEIAMYIREWAILHCSYEKNK